MIKWLFLAGLFLFLTFIGAGITYDKDEKDIGASLGAGAMLSLTITIIVGSLLW